MMLDDTTEARLRQDDLGRALRALPLARAPLTLAPRVMAAIAAGMAAARRDYTWFDWPAWARLVSAAALVGLVAVTVWWWPVAEAAVADVTGRGVIRWVLAFVHTVWQPLVMGLTVTITLLALFGATVGALLDRVALGEVSR